MIADSDLAILISICVSVMTNLEGPSNSLAVVSPSLADTICHWPVFIDWEALGRFRELHILIII